MARLSDFQIPDAPIPVDQKLMARNAKAARTQVDWKKTRTSATDLALQPYQTFLMDAGSNIDIEEPEESDSNENQNRIVTKSQQKRRPGMRCKTF